MPFDDDPFLVVASARRGRRADTVLLGRSLEPVGRSSGIVTALLAVGMPVLLLVVGVTTWRVVGRRWARSRRSGPRST